MKKSLYLTAAAAFALTSCSQDDLLNGIFGSNDNAIAFDSYLGKSAQTRATVVDKESLKTEGFTVDAYYTETADFSSSATSTEFMKGTKVAYNGEDEIWVYSPVKYWPNNGGKVSFFAYGPYGNTNIVRNTTTVSSIDFTVQKDVRNQVDFIYHNQGDENGTPTLNLTKPTVNDKVSFKFQHALSRISFSVAAAVDETSVGTVKLDGNSRINVKKVALVDANASSYTENAAGPFYKSGTLDMLTGEWSNYSAETQSFTLAGKDNFYRTITDKDVETSNDIDVVQLHKFNQSQRLLNDSSYVMIIPTDISEVEDAKTSFKIYIEYDVITEDDNNNDVSKITNKILSQEALNVTFEQGKAYNFNLILGMTSVKFDVDDVVAWEDAAEDDYEDDYWFDKNKDEDDVDSDEATNTYTVHNEQELLAWNQIALNDPSVNLIIANDITLTGENNWTPLGYIEIIDEDDPNHGYLYHEFTGTIDGRGHTITGLSITNQTAAFIKLLGTGGVVKDLNFAEAKITGEGDYNSAAVIANSNDGKIENCHVLSGAVSAEYQAGGVAASSDGIISGCTNAAEVKCNSYGGLGGIVGDSWYGYIIGCTNKGKIISTNTNGSSAQGGVVGMLHSVAIACCNMGELEVSALPQNVGGISSQVYSYSGIAIGSWTLDTYEYLVYDIVSDDDKNGIGHEPSLSNDTYDHTKAATTCYSGDAEKLNGSDVINAMNDAIDAYNATADVDNKCSWKWVAGSNGEYPTLQKISD